MNVNDYQGILLYADKIPKLATELHWLPRIYKDFQGVPTINHDTQKIAADSNGYQRVPMMPEGLASINWYK